MALWSHSSIGQKVVMRLQTSGYHIYYIHGEPYFQGRAALPRFQKKNPKPTPRGGGGGGGGPKKNLKIANQIKSNKRTPLVAPRASIHFTWSWEGDKQTNKQTNHHHHHHYSWGCPPDKRQRSPPSRGEKSR
jgi:hypothetical protein